MAERPRWFVDWLLVRARIEPGHERPLRVAMKHPDGADGPLPEEAFADADAAASFVRNWLHAFVRRWEASEAERLEETR